MENILIPLIIVAVVVMLIIGALFNDKAVVNRKLKKHKKVSLKYFKDNETSKVVGTLDSISAPFLSPLTLKDVIYYKVIVEQYKSSGDNNGSWKTIYKSEKSNDLYLRDENEIAFIDNKRIKYDLFSKYTYNSSNGMNPNVRNFLRSKGIDTENLLGFNKKFKLTEHRLEKGQQVAVVGEGFWDLVENEELDVDKVFKMDGENDYIYMSDSKFLMK